MRKCNNRSLIIPQNSVLAGMFLQGLAATCCQQASHIFSKNSEIQVDHVIGCRKGYSLSKCNSGSVIEKMMNTKTSK